MTVSSKPYDWNKIIGWVASITSVTGSTIVAVHPPKPWMFAAMLIWSASNMIWIGYAVRTHQNHLMTRDLIYLVLNLIGIIRWS